IHGDHRLPIKQNPGNARFCWKTGAGNETRTRDPDLGKVVLYQLSYSRLVSRESKQKNGGCEALGPCIAAPNTAHGGRPGNGEAPANRGFVRESGAGNETRTRDPDLGKVVLYQLSYSRLGGRILIRERAASRLARAPVQ